jgi:inositol polyphosphate 1-phosphatase
MLAVCDGTAAAFVSQLGGSYKWDTCAPHAVLMARGGGVVCPRTGAPLRYHMPDSSELPADKKWLNSTGALVTLDNAHAAAVRAALRRE